MFNKQIIFKDEYFIHLFSSNNIFSTEEKPKKRNEKECQWRSTELRAVCQGLRWKYSFCGATAESKRKIFRSNPQGLDLYKQLKRSYFRISFLFLLTKIYVNGLQSTDFEDESPRISGICTYFFLVNIQHTLCYSHLFYVKILNFLNNLRWGFWGFRGFSQSIVCQKDCGLSKVDENR